MKAKIFIVKDRGMPWHYHHFITDVVLPFFRRTEKNRSKITDVYFKDNQYQSIGTFTKHFEDFFGIKAHLLKPRKFRNLKAPILRLKSMALKSFTDRNYKSLYRYLRDNLKVQCDKSPKILLIQRSKEDLHFDNLEKARRNKTGAERRRIGNHKELRDALSKKGVVNLVLEGMNFLDQIKYFFNAKVIIGQHGAGLTNMVWMPAGKVLELISEKSEDKSFWKPYLKGKNVVFRDLVFPSKGGVNNEVLFVDPQKVIRSL
jgi:hypothetical protein